MSLFVATGNNGKIREYAHGLSAVLQHFCAPNEPSPIAGIRDLQDRSKIAFSEPVEDFDFFLGNGILKMLHALTYVKKTSYPNIRQILVDDSGLCVPSLGLDPGVNSAYYAGFPRDPNRNRWHLQDQIRKATECNSVDELRLPAFFVCFLCTMPNDSEVADALINHDADHHNFHPASLKSIENECMDAACNAVNNGIAHAGHHSFTLPFRSLYPHLSSDLSIQIHFGYCIGEISTHEQYLMHDAGHGYDSMFYSRRHPNYSFASVGLEQKNQESHRAMALQAFHNTCTLP